MRKLLLGSAVLLVCVGCAQGLRTFGGVRGSGVANTKSRTVGAFDKIQVLGSTDVQVNVGKSGDIKIEGDDNIIPLIETKVEGDTLVIKTKDNSSYSTSQKLLVTVPVEKLSGLDLSGSADVKIAGVSGAELDLSISGSGNIDATGEVDHLSTNVSGSGNMRLKDLAAKSVSADLSGSGDVGVNAKDQLDVTIAGSGGVHYTGSPSITKSIVGSGEVRKD